MTRRVKPGTPCPACAAPMVVITHETLVDIQAFLRPNIRTISSQALKRTQQHYRICKTCDAYALGAELTRGFPFLDVDGEMRDVHGHCFSE